MAVIDGGGGGPTLNPKAKHYERQLFKVFSSSTASIWLTQDDWKGARTQLEALARDVRSVQTELQAPSNGGRGWQGPAAEAALASLEKLSSTLDGHAVKVGDVDTSLGQVYTAITDAKAAWYSEVASISTYVDPDDHMRLPAPYLPTPQNTAAYSVPDTEAAAAAEDALWEQRNQAAKRVLDQLGTDTQTATATMPIETRTRSEAPYTPSGPGGSNGSYPTGTATPSTSGGYAVHPDTGFVLHDDGDGGGDGDRDDEDVPQVDPQDPEVTIGDPEQPKPDPDPDLDPISSDGDVTGSVGTNPTGGPSPSGTSTTGGGGGGIGAGGLAAGGLGAGAAGVGGILGARGGGLTGAGGAGGPRGGSRGATTGVRPGGAAGGRGGGLGATGGARGGATMVPGGGGTSGQSRAGASGRASAVKGASGSGRYGVPKLDGKGTGVVPAGSGQAAKAGGSRAGGRGAAGRGAPASSGRGGVGTTGAAGAGGARKGDRAEATGVDRLTHEDEDTWYDGTDESSPQVWD